MRPSRGTRTGQLVCCVLPLLGAVLPVAAPAQQPAQSRRPSTETRADKRGLILKTDAAFTGYTLFAPLNSTTTYLVDLEGHLIHSWPSRYTPGQAVYLLDDGSVLRSAREPRNRHFGGGGIGGRIERIAPDGRLLWEFGYANENHCQHHDIEPLPNGHVLLIAWEKKTREQAIAAGRDPNRMTGKELWPDCIIEVEPEGVSGGKIVWEWHVWDHLVQDYDPARPNHGVVADHPELVDLNYRQRAPRQSPAELKRLRSLGYVGGAESEEETEEQRPGPPRLGPGAGPGPGGVDGQADWCHTNAVAYNAGLGQIALSVHNFNEIWIIDHSTTTEESAGHKGGRYGRGGDLLYRWGNPRAYGAGDSKDQMLFAQHDVRWIPEGRPGSGHLLVFNNGMGRPDGSYSSVVEFAQPVDSSGHHRRDPGHAFGPEKPSWEYTTPNKTELFSASISGAERLLNGNTLICSGERGRFLEVTAEGSRVWEYVNPYIERNGPDEGPTPPGGRPIGARFGEGPASEGARTDERDATSATPAGGQDERPVGRPRPGGPPSGGPGSPPGPRPRGFPGGGPGGPPGGGVFRAARFAPDHPGVRKVLEVANPQ